MERHPLSSRICLFTSLIFLLPSFSLVMLWFVGRVRCAPFPMFPRVRRWRRLWWRPGQLWLRNRNWLGDLKRSVARIWHHLYSHITAQARLLALIVQLISSHPFISMFLSPRLKAIRLGGRCRLCSLLLLLICFGVLCIMSIRVYIPQWIVVAVLILVQRLGIRKICVEGWVLCRVIDEVE